LGEPIVHPPPTATGITIDKISLESLLSEKCWNLGRNFARVVAATVVVTMATRSMDPCPTTMSLATGFVASLVATMSNPSIYTNYVNVHLSIDKLDETNYDTWASDIKLWLKS